MNLFSFSKRSYNNSPRLSFLIIAVVIFLAACNKESGKLRFSYNKGTAIYGKIDEVRSQTIVGPARPIENPGKIHIGENFILIGEKNKGIHVFNNTNTLNPVASSFINLPFTKEFYVEDNKIYAESHYDFLKIDLSDINNPILLDREEYAFGQPISNEKGEVVLGFEYHAVTESFELNSEEAEMLRKSSYLYYDEKEKLIPASAVPSSFAGTNSNIKGTLNKIAVSNDHIYVIGENELHCFQNSASEITYLNSKSISHDQETIYPENNRLFIGTQNSMVVVDISNPSSPEMLSEYTHPTSCDPVYPHGNVAYLTLRTADFSGCSGDENTLEVIDISNINSPVLLEEITMKSPYGMSVINDHLFVGEGANGISSTLR